MAMSVPKVGINRFMKEGVRYMQGVEEAVLRNIDACVELSATTKSCYGPKGMSKMVINHIEKLFVTNDAATILNELEVQHPAAKMLVMASKMQEQEIGDGTNFVIILAASLLEHAADLINMGLKPIEIADGYEKATEFALKQLEELVCGEIKDCRNYQAVRRAVRACVMSKQYGYEDILSDLATRACLSVMPADHTAAFNVDNVRVAKILGNSVKSSTLINGMVFKRSAEGEIRSLQNANIAIYTCPLDVTQTETKGTVLINTAVELKNFSRGEEKEIEQQLDEIKAAGINCVVAGGKFGDLYLHHLNARGIMAVRLTSKFDIRRLAKSVGATPMTMIGAPTPDNIGHCAEVVVEEIGDTEVTVFRQTAEKGKVSTIVLRGSSDNILDDMERSIDDCVNTVKALTKDGRLVPGAGAVEVELARKVEDFGAKCSGLEQYAIKQFALSLESLPKQIIDNAGLKSSEQLAKVCAAHAQGNANACVDLCAAEENKDNTVGDANALNIVDLFVLKQYAIKLASDAARTVLKIDHIIMAKPAGGPKPKGGPKGMDTADDD